MLPAKMSKESITVMPVKERTPLERLRFEKAWHLNKLRIHADRLKNNPLSCEVALMQSGLDDLEHAMAAQVIGLKALLEDARADYVAMARERAALKSNGRKSKKPFDPTALPIVQRLDNALKAIGSV